MEIVSIYEYGNFSTKQLDFSEQRSFGPQAFFGLVTDSPAFDVSFAWQFPSPLR